MERVTKANPGRTDIRFYGGGKARWSKPELSQLDKLVNHLALEKGKKEGLSLHDMKEMENVRSLLDESDLLNYDTLKGLADDLIIVDGDKTVQIIAKYFLNYQAKSGEFVLPKHFVNAPDTPGLLLPTAPTEAPPTSSSSSTTGGEAQAEGASTRGKRSASKSGMDDLEESTSVGGGGGAENVGSSSSGASSGASGAGSVASGTSSGGGSMGSGGSPRKKAKLLNAAGSGRSLEEDAKVRDAERARTYDVLKRMEVHGHEGLVDVFAALYGWYQGGEMVELPHWSQDLAMAEWDPRGMEAEADEV